MKSLLLAFLLPLAASAMPVDSTPPLDNGNAVIEASLTASTVTITGGALIFTTVGSTISTSGNSLDITTASVANAATSKNLFISNTGNVTINRGGVDSVNISTNLISALNMAASPFFVYNATSSPSGTQTESAFGVYGASTLGFALLKATNGTFTNANNKIYLSSMSLTQPQVWSNFPAFETGLWINSVNVSTGYASFQIATDEVWTDQNSTTTTGGKIPTMRAWRLTDQNGVSQIPMLLTSSGTLVLGSISTYDQTSSLDTAAGITDRGQLTVISSITVQGSGGALFSSASPVTISSAAFLGVSVTTITAGGAGSSVTALCLAGKFAMGGGCLCTGGVALTGQTSTPNCVTAGCVPSGWTCQEPGGTGGACSAYVICSRAQ